MKAYIKAVTTQITLVKLKNLIASLLGQGIPPSNTINVVHLA